MPERQNAREREKPSLGKPFFPCRHVRLFQLEEMDHAQMDPTDWGRIIIDQADPTRPARAGNRYLFIEFTPHGRLVRIQVLTSLCVFFGHVPADPQRSQSVQPCLAL